MIVFGDVRWELGSRAPFVSDVECFERIMCRRHFVPNAASSTKQGMMLGELDGFPEALNVAALDNWSSPNDPVHSWKPDFHIHIIRYSKAFW